MTKTAKGAPPPATDPNTAGAPTPVMDAMRAEFARAVLEDMPEHGRLGSYQPGAVDRWASEPAELPDGDFEALGWRFTIAGDRLALAVKLPEAA
jgi:hypothetical protein